MKNNNFTESIESKMFRLRDAINVMIPFKKCDYRNMVVADAIAKGKADKLTEDWLRRVLLTDVEDGFITYAESLALAPQYTKAIEELKKIR